MPGSLSIYHYHYFLLVYATPATFLWYLLLFRPGSFNPKIWHAG